VDLTHHDGEHRRVSETKILLGVAIDDLADLQ
jgi:hypothetical protein